MYYRQYLLPRVEIIERKAVRDIGTLKKRKLGFYAEDKAMLNDYEDIWSF